MQFSPCKMHRFHHYHLIPNCIDQYNHRIKNEAILRRWDPYQQTEIETKIFHFYFGGVNWPPKWPFSQYLGHLGANLHPQNENEIFFLKFKFPYMFLTFSNWPHLLFYDYFEWCNKVFSENGDFAEKYMHFAVKCMHFTRWKMVIFKCCAAGVK